MSSRWPVEIIPDEDHLFMRAHRNFIRDRQLIPGVFRDQGDGMSTNWKKYCATPEEARAMAKNPADNGIISLQTGKIRKIQPLSVEHAPDHIRDDRSHTEVRGKKDSEIRLRLLKIYDWALELS